MVEACVRERWNHTSAILALIYNTAQGRRGPSRTPQQFHPLAPEPTPKDKTAIHERSVSVLHAMAGVHVKGTRVR